MEPGKIRLVNTGAEHPENYQQTIALAINNRLYRITNTGTSSGGPGTMRIRATRSVLWMSIPTIFDLTAGRSVDVYGHTVSVLALDTLELFGTYDTI